MERRTKHKAFSGYRRILWPTDLSRLARAALPHALQLAAGSKGELVIVHVLPTGCSLRVSRDSGAPLGSDRPGESVERKAEARPDHECDQGRAPRAPGPQRLGERRGLRGGPAGGETPPLRPDRARHPRAHRTETRADGQCGRERGAASALSGADRAAAGIQIARITSGPG